jgi:hypothetical protein
MEGMTMFTEEAFQERMGELTAAMYPAEELEAVRAAVYPPQQSRLLYLYMKDVQKRRPRGTPEDNPIVIPVLIWEKFFPAWRDKALNPNLQTFSFENPPPVEP